MSVAAAETHASILSLPQLVNDDAGLVRRGRYLAPTFLVEAGDAEFLVRGVESRGVLDEIRPAARSGSRSGHHAPPPITRITAASSLAESGRPAQMISPRSIT